MSAMTGDIVIMPIIDNAIVPSSLKPRSNSLPKPKRLPKMRSIAAIIEKIDTTTDIRFIISPTKPLQQTQYQLGHIVQ